MGLSTYIARRLILLIPVLLGVSLLVYAVTLMLPPETRAMLYVRSPKEAKNLDAIIKKYGLADPLYVQYFTWINQVLHGNLGWSQIDTQPVMKSIITRFPATLEIVMYAAPITILLGIYLGVISATHKDKAPDHITRSLAIIGWSLPSFWLAMILMAVFYIQLDWFAPERISRPIESAFNSGQLIPYTHLYTIDGILNGRLDVTLEAFRHLIMPIIVLVVIQVAGIIRVMRSSMLEALSKGYVIAARAKGLSPSEVINKHARRNALIPVVTLSGLMIGGMLTGVVITETVFNIPGIGRWGAQAALAPDLPSIVGFATFAAVIYVLTNLVVDVIYAYIDPRIRLG